METLKTIKTINEKIYYHPCIKCKSDNIIFNDYGYSSFNYAFARCNNCKNEITFPCMDASKKEIIKKWNESNDPKILYKNYKDQIEKLQKLIDDLNIDI